MARSSAPGANAAGARRRRSSARACARWSRRCGRAPARRATVEAGPAACRRTVVAMKVLLLAPAPTEVFLGGAATVTRYREGLQRYGHLCELFGGTSDGDLKQSLAGTIGRFKPDIVHAHDA